MSHAGTAQTQKLVTELKVSGHLMTLEQGLFCVFHAPGSVAADPQSGLPGVRITHPPLQDRARLSISGFSDDGWIGAEAGAALVRVNHGPAQLLVTIYQSAAGQNESPKLQVMRLGDVPGRAAATPPHPAAAEAAPSRAADEAAAAAPPPAANPPVAAVEGAEVAAHVQRRGDRLGKLGDWMGEPGSQSWIEGFAIAPNRMIGPEDIEYQAVLGKGWLSPWSEGGQYCGSRGMALPILGLRVRLKGDAADTHSLRVSATFTDGSRIGPISDSDTAEAESLAPLEAFRIEVLPQAGFEPDAADEEDEPGAGPLAAAAVSQPPPQPPRALQTELQPQPQERARRTSTVAPAPPKAPASAPAGKPRAGKAPPGRSPVAKPPPGKPGRPARG